MANPLFIMRLIYLFLCFFLSFSSLKLEAQWVSPYNSCPEKPKFLNLNSADWCQIHSIAQRAVIEEGLANTLGYEKATSILLGLIQKESSFKKNAIGKAGEIGLTQIKPATARFICKIKEEDLLDIKLNLNCSAKYLNMLLEPEYFDKDLQMALIAYNKGWGNVKKGLFERKDLRYAKLIVEEYSPLFDFSQRSSEKLQRGL